MQIVWNYGAVQQLDQDADAWNWSGPEGDGAEPTPGGVFHRARPSWLRVFRRKSVTLDRTIERAPATLARLWRYSPLALSTESGAPLIAAASDDREYGIDCSAAPELATGTGITISSGAMSGGSGLTFGSPAVLAAAFDDIPSGKGLSVRISGTTTGTHKFACTVTLSNGRKFVVPGRLVKVADYDS